jgi:hypothetical protein
MKIQIDNKTVLHVAEEYYAPMKRIKKKEGYIWTEYKWFSNLERCIKYLVQQRLAEKKETVQLSEFLKMYKELHNEIRELLAQNNVF